MSPLSLRLALAATLIAPLASAPLSSFAAPATRALAPLPFVPRRADVAGLAPPDARSHARARHAAPASLVAPAVTASQTAGDGAGGFYVAWTDASYFTTAFGITEVLVQHFTASGTVASGWPAGGLRVANVAGNEDEAMLLADGAGGVIVGWTALDSGYPLPRAQRLNSSGVRLWGNEGVVIGTSGAYQYLSDLESDGAGGAYFTYSDQGPDFASETRGYVQHVDAGGSIVAGWPGGGLALAGTSGAQDAPFLVDDGSGGAIACWGDGRNGPFEAFAQRFAADGTRLWSAADGVRVHDNTLEDFQCASDGAGGLLCAWNAPSASTNTDVFLQHYGPTGSPLLAPGGVTVVNAVQNQDGVAIAPDGAGGLLFTWNDDRDGFAYLTLYALRTNLNGAPLAGWPANGVRITNSDPMRYGLLGDGAGGAFVYWSRPGTAGSITDLAVTRVTGAGAIGSGFGADGLALTAPGASPDDATLAIARNAAGGVVATWWDTRTSETSFDLFGHSCDGSANPVVGWALSGKLLKSELRRQAHPDFALEGSGIGITWQDKRSTRWEIFGASYDGDGVATSPTTSYSSNSNDRIEPRRVPDGSNGSYLAWNTFNNGEWSMDVQHLAPFGAPLWSPGGFRVLSGLRGFTPPLLVPDGTGGAIVGQEDEFGANFLVQRLDANGSPLWTAGGVATPAPCLGGASDGAGGLVTLFAYFDTGSIPVFDLRVQHVDPLGAIAWPDTGRRVATPPLDRFGGIAAPDGAGGLFVAWAEGDYLGGDVVLRVQRLDGSGNVAPGWPASGRAVRSVAPGKATPAALVPDGSGGVIVGWWDLRSGALATYVQNVDASGSIVWPVTDGRELASSGPGDPALLVSLVAGAPVGPSPQKSGTARTHAADGRPIALWMDGRGPSWDLYAQKLDASGDPMWAAGGVAVCAADETQGNVRGVADGEGGLYAVWQDARTRPFDAIVAQRVDSSGVVLWDTDGIVSTLASLVAAGVSGGTARLEWRIAPGAIAVVDRSPDGAAWTRLGTFAADGAGRVRIEDGAIQAGRRYAWRIALASAPDEPLDVAWLTVPDGTRLAVSRARLESHGRRIALAFTLPADGAATVEVLDVAGRVRSRTALDGLARGPHETTLDASRLAPGLYWVRIAQREERASARLAVLR